MWRWRVCSLALLAACTDSGEYSDFQVQASVHDAKLSLAVVGEIPSLQPAESQFITDANTVSARFQGQTIALVLSVYAFPIGYYADVDLTEPVMADEPIAFTIDRLGTTATLTSAIPPDFTVVPPVSPKIGAPVDITWSPTSTDTMSWSGTVCDLDAIEGPVRTDTGMLEFPPAVFDPDPQYPCPDPIELTMTRSRTTTPDTAFRYVQLVSERQHTIDFMETP